MKKLTINRARALGKDMNAKGVVILSKPLFNDEGFEEHPDTDVAWLRGRL